MKPDAKLFPIKKFVMVHAIALQLWDEDRDLVRRILTAKHDRKIRECRKTRMSEIAIKLFEAGEAGPMTKPPRKGYRWVCTICRAIDTVLRVTPSPR